MEFILISLCINLMIFKGELKENECRFIVQQLHTKYLMQIIWGQLKVYFSIFLLLC